MEMTTGFHKYVIVCGHFIKNFNLQNSLTKMGRKPIVGGNWKCNPDDPSKLDGLVANINACDTSKCDVYVCPSPLHCGIVYKSFTNGAFVAPQNCNFKGCGAYTGEMCADQMVAMGMKWCLIGHSERRGEFGLPTPAESDDLIANVKMGYLLEKGMCVTRRGPHRAPLQLCPPLLTV